MSSGPRTLNGKIVLQVYLLDNSYKTVLIEPTSTIHVRRAARAGWCAARAPPRRRAHSSSSRAHSSHAAAHSPRTRTSTPTTRRPRAQDVCRSMADKIGFDDAEEDCMCFSLNECLDGVTSACGAAGSGAGSGRAQGLRAACAGKMCA